MSVKWSKLTPTQRAAGRRLAERAWAAGLTEVTVTKAAENYPAVLAAVEQAEGGKS